jgi:hypothetical protein
LQAKNNLANAPGLAFQVREKLLSNGITAPYIEFEKGTVGITADEVLSSATQGRKPISRNEAEEFLRRELQLGPVLAETLFEKANNEGISNVTLRRAKKELDIVDAKQGFQGKSMWMLPQFVRCTATGVFDATLIDFNERKQLNKLK